MTAHLLEENKFLRGVLEAQNRDAAELRAALRSALAAMPKALTKGESGEPVSRNAASETDVQVLADVPQTPEDGLERHEKAVASVVSSGVVNGPKFERQRGFRAWLLQVLPG